jgi:hypothetical protein
LVQSDDWNDVDSNDYYMAFHLTVDSEYIESDRYQKTPFCSLVIRFNNITEMQSFCTFAEKKETTKIFERLQAYSSTYPIQLLNAYKDEEYDTIAAKFDHNQSFHSMILYMDSTGKTLDESPLPEHHLLISAIPFSGIISPITKSPFHTLYNGKFIPCKKFQLKSTGSSTVHNEWYKAIVYVYADIHSSFAIHEFHNPEDESLYGTETIHLWSYSKWMRHIKYDKIVNDVLYAGNENLFEKPRRNLFHLSDIPNDIANRGDSLMRKMD